MVWDFKHNKKLMFALLRNTINGRVNMFFELFNNKKMQSLQYVFVLLHIF